MESLVHAAVPGEGRTPLATHGGATMALEARANLILGFARTLFINGQATDQVLDSSKHLGRALELEVEIVPRWGQLQLVDADGKLLAEVTADPVGVGMNRVAALMRAGENARSGRLAPSALTELIGSISRMPPASTPLFMLAAAAGAVALAVIFGLRHVAPGVLIAVSAVAGAALRRALARYTANGFVQPFCAALLAGTIGALAAHDGLSSSLRLVAVAPCMILVPGPHVLNAAMDLIKGRIHLGAARALYAGLIIVTISLGLLLGLAVFGAALPVDPVGRSVPLWEDTIAAGFAVAAYGIFFAAPLRMLPCPVAVGMLAHALRWVAISFFGASVTLGALVACLFVSLVLTPVSRRWHMPFAAIGFASVVSLMPGVYIFRLSSGLLQIAGGSETTLQAISATVSDALTAATIILAMSFGLIVPKLLIDFFSDRHSPKGAV